MGEPSTDPPVTLTFLAPAERCNQRCPACILDRTGEPVQSFDLSPDDFALGVSQFVAAGARIRAVLFQGYEVTLPRSWPYVEAVFRVAREHSIRRGFITNGMLLHKWIDRTAALDTQRVTVSLDGASPEVNDPIRGIKGAFNATVESLRAFVQRVPGYRTRLAVASCVYPRQNEASLREMPRLLRSLGIERWLITFEVMIVDGVGRPAQAPETIPDTLRSLLEAADRYGVRAIANDELGVLNREVESVPLGLRTTRLIEPDYLYRIEPSGHVPRGPRGVGGLVSSMRSPLASRGDFHRPGRRVLGREPFLESSALESFQRVQYLLYVAFHPDFREDSFHPTVFIDEHGGADDPHRLFAVEVLLPPSAVLLQHRSIGIAEEREVEVVLRCEPVVGLERILAHADRDGIQLVELLLRVPEITGFGGAPGSVVARVEVKHDVLAFEVLQRERASPVLRQLEGRGLVPFFEWTSLCHARFLIDAGRGRQPVKRVRLVVPDHHPVLIS